MSQLVILLLVYGVAGALPLAALAAALGLAAHHRRRSRIAAYALDPGARVTEGPALLQGWVEDDEGAPPGPAIAVEVEPGRGGTGAAWRVRARGFGLRLPSGQVLRVEPEEDGARVRVEQTFQPTQRGGARAYATEIHAGELVHLAGEVRREIDARSSGRGYRDAAMAWVVRAPAGGALAFVSERMVALHARRAIYHLRWAVGLGAALAVNALFLRGFHAAVLSGGAAAAARWAGGGSLLIAALLGLGLPLVYRAAADGSRPWLDRSVA